MQLKRWIVPAALLLALAACGDAGEGPLAPAPDDRSGDAVALQPLIANGCEAYEGACDDEEETDTGGGSGSDYSVPGGDAGTAGGTTSGDGDGSAEMSDGLEMDEEWNCDNHKSFDQASGECNLQEPTEEDRQNYREAVEQIRTDDSDCAMIRSYAEMAEPNFKVWTNTLTVWDQEDGRFKTLYGDAQWIYRADGTVDVSMHLWRSGMDARVVAHEAMHLRGWLHDGVYGGRTMDQWASFCTAS